MHGTIPYPEKTYQLGDAVQLVRLRCLYNESFNGRLRDELLNETLFRSLQHAQTVLETRRRDYKEQRPHSKLGWLTPWAFAEALRGHAAGGAAQP